MTSQTIKKQIKQRFDTDWNITVAELAREFGLPIKEVREILLEEN